jgi:hypothetical protein
MNTERTDVHGLSAPIGLLRVHPGSILRFIDNLTTPISGNRARLLRRRLIVEQSFRYTAEAQLSGEVA